jgi:aminoglycoside phosphotransferase (APT) family kinase protein
MSEFDHFVGTRAVSRTTHFRHDAAEHAWLEPTCPVLPAHSAWKCSRAGNPTRPTNSIHRRASYVMRAKPGPVAKLLPSAHAVEREFAVMRGCRAPMCRYPHVLPVRRRIGHWARLLRHGVHAGPCVVGPVPARHEPGRSAARIYNEMNRVIAALHTVNFASGAGQLRQTGQLFRAPDRPLEQAIRRLGHPAHCEMDS